VGACRIRSILAARRWPLLLCGLLAGGVLTLSGCGHSTSKPMPLDKQVAQDAFKVFLDSWKSGQQQAALKDKAPSIIANDPAWASGAKLLDYTPVDFEKSDGSNLHPTVDLDLQTAEGTHKARVTYVVSSYPKITVFREN
jgi:hypothetical protein